MNTPIQNTVLAIVCAAYPDQAVMPTQFGGAGMDGDTLATFVVNEVTDVTSSQTDIAEAKTAASEALQRAATDLLQVANALRC